MKKRFLSTLMALCLALSLLPATALAAEGGTQLPTAVGGVITLDENVTLSEAWQPTESVILDLSGYKLSLERVNVQDGVTVTITDSKDKGEIEATSTRSVVVFNGGTLILENGTITSTQLDSSDNIAIFNMGTFTIKDGKIEGGTKAGTGVYNTVRNSGSLVKRDVICNIEGGVIEASYGVCAFGPGVPNGDLTQVDNEKLTINITDGTIKTNGQGIATNASSGIYAGFTVNMSGGAIEDIDNASTGMYLPAIGVTNITGGTITASQAIRIGAGELNISSGTITCTAKANGEDLIPGGSGGTTGAIVVGKASGGYVGDIEVNVSGSAVIQNTAEKSDDSGTVYPTIVVSDKNMADTADQQFLDPETGVRIEKTFNYSETKASVIVNARVDGDVVKTSTLPQEIDNAKDGGNTTLEISGGTVTGNVINQTRSSDLEITGGTITGNVTNSSKGETVISNAEVNGTVSNTGEDGNKGSVAIIDSTVGAVSKEDASITIVNSTIGDDEEPTTNVGENVAMVGVNVYPTLKDAIDAANEGDTVRLLNDVTLSASGIEGENGAQALTIDKDLTIDGKGKYTIKGENFAANVRLITVTGGADVTFNEVTLDGGNVEPDTQGARHGLNLWNAGKVMLNDVRIKNCDWYAVANNGSELIVNGLTTNGNAWGINIDNNGTAVINNANISEDSSIVYENGEGNGSLTVNGGTYQNLVVQAEDEEDVCGGTIELKDGSFKGVTTNGKGETNDTEIVSISGGNYDTDVSKYVDSGLTWDPSTGEVAKPVEPDDDDDRPSQGGGSSSSEPSYSPVMDVSKGGSVKVNPRTPGEGDEVTITVDPDRGYEVGDVTVTDRSGRDVRVTAERDGTYTFEQPKGRVTIAVTFVREGTSTFFTDVAETYWAYDEIAWAYENGYVNGVTATTFAPGASISRQQIWMILARIAGDDPADMAAARQWSIDNGISDGTNPGSAVTRQQLAALLYRYAQMMGYANEARVDLSSFPDAGSVASYAVEPMQWSVANSIVGGTTDGTLNPTGTATRAQFAVMLYRFWTGV